jgi:hypothetical protein
MFQLECPQCASAIDNHDVTVRTLSRVAAWRFDARCGECGLRLTGPLASPTAFRAIMAGARLVYVDFCQREPVRASRPRCGRSANAF